MNALALKNPIWDSIVGDFFDNAWFENQISSSETNDAHYRFDEKTKEHIINIETPGFSKDEIEIEVNEKGIKISGEIKDEKIKEKIGEKKFSYFMKKTGINYKDIEAELESGILEIKFKDNKEKLTKKIAIK